MRSPVLSVHYQVRAGLKLGDARKPARQVVRAGSAGAYDFDPYPILFEQAPGLHERVHGQVVCGFLRGPLQHMRHVTFIAHETAQPKAFLQDLAGQLERRLAELDASPVLAHVDIQKHADAATFFSSSCGERASGLCVVHNRDDVGAL